MVIDKKGELHWDELGTWILAIGAGVVIIFGVIFFKDAIISMLTQVRDIMRFGG
jgi:hypothetical protein